jgi:hypothetical protein
MMAAVLSSRPRRLRRRIGVSLVAVVVVVVVLVFATMAAWPRRARADADEWQLSARTGIASVVVDHRDPLGVRAAIDGQYGLDDAWAIRATGSLARIGVSADAQAGLPGGAIWAYSALVGLVYTMDVLRLLPTFEVSAAMLEIRGAVVKPRRAIGLQAALGADYLLRPRLSVGGIAEYIFAPFDLVSNALNGNAIPQAFAFSIRVSWTFH